MRFRAVVAVALLGGLPAACRTASGEDPPPPPAMTFASRSVAAGARFEASDLPRILLHADEAPDGTRTDPTLAHASGLDSFARDAAERQALERDGFRSGYVVLFPPDSYFRHEPHAVTDVAFQAIGGLFEDAEGASSSLHRFVEDLRTRQMVGAADVSADRLGEESFGLAGGASLDGSFVRVYAWRESNLILVLVASGPNREDDVLALARTMDRRAG